jgi:hypothetical protein
MDFHSGSNTKLLTKCLVRQVPAWLVAREAVRGKVVRFHLFVRCYVGCPDVLLWCSLCCNQKCWPGTWFIMGRGRGYRYYLCDFFIRWTFIPIHGNNGWSLDHFYHYYRRFVIHLWLTYLEIRRSIVCFFFSQMLLNKRVVIDITSVITSLS